MTSPTIRKVCKEAGKTAGKIIRTNALLALVIASPAAAAEQSAINQTGAYQILPATTLEITQPVTIPANHSRALFQYGQPTTFKEMDLYQHHCWLETSKRDSRPQTIAPGKARIMKVRHGSEDVDQLTDNLITRLELRSTQQPQLNAIQCEVWSDSATDFGHFISVQELLDTFGGVLKIKPLKRP